MSRAVRVSIFLAAALVCAATSARGDVRDLIGRPIADVRIELGGQPFSDPALAALIETRVGEPLRMEAVRATVDHLIGLGRFEDVRVFATASTARAEAVALRWVLAPVQRIDRIDVEGAIALDRTALRAELADRFGARPSTTRVPEMIDALRAFYRLHGYRSPDIAASVRPTEVAELVTLTLAVNSGPRTRVARTTIEGHPPLPEAQLVARLRLQPGEPYDAPAIESRLDRYEEELRDAGHYEAAVDSSVEFSDDGGSASVRVTVEPGPRVRVVFAGDPLPEGRRDTLVPIRRERSIDLDLLEDASRNIEAFLRQQGYRAAQAPYTRETRESDTVLTFAVSRGALHKVASSDIAGHSAVSRADLLPLLLLTPGEPFVESRVVMVASAITELYRVRGFARAAVKPEISVLPPQIENGQEYRPVTVRFVIAEGLPTTIADVAIEGVVQIAESRVRSLLALTAGRPFYRPQLDADRESIERLYRNEGFQDVRVSAESTLRDDGRRINLKWVVREGTQTLVDHVLITGNLHTASDVIRDEIPLQPGQPLGEDAMVESQRRLAALGLFRRVRITALPHGSTTNRDILIEVEEAPSTTVSYGGGVEVVPRLRRAAETGRAEAHIEVAPRGFFEVGRRNLWGKNRAINVFTRVSFRPRDPAIDSSDPTDVGGYGFNEYRVVGTFREPRPFNRAGEGQLTAFLEQAVRSSFNFSRRGGRAEYARRVGTSLTISGRYAFDYTRLFDEQIKPEDRPLVDRLFPQIRLSTFTGSLLRDSRNDVIDPQRGALTGVDVSLAPRVAGSEVGFARTFAQGFLYRHVPALDRFVLAAGARLGFAVGFTETVDRLVPASERFFAGGDTTVRGFVLDQLGAEDTLNDQGFPTGGNGLVVFNIEMRTPYWKGIGGVAFLDTGNVFRRATDIRLGDLRSAAGFGVRYKSPVGPLRVDLGFNLDSRLLRNGTPERGSVLHISLGQAF